MGQRSSVAAQVGTLALLMALAGMRPAEAAPTPTGPRPPGALRVPSDDALFNVTRPREPSPMSTSRAPTAPSLSSETTPPTGGTGPTAPPQAKTIAILVLSGEESGVESLEIYEAARKALEENTAYVVAPLDVIGFAARANVIRQCAGRGECFAEAMRAHTTGIDLLLTTSVDALGVRLLLGLRLVDVGEGRELGASGDEIPPGLSLARAIERQLESVVPGALWGQIADVIIETIPTTAEVTVGGRTCASPCQLRRMTPGTHAFVARRDGFEEQHGELTLAPRGTAQLTVHLTSKSDRGSILSSPYLWAGGVVVASALAVGSYFLLRPSSRSIDVCVASDPSLCRNAN